MPAGGCVAEPGFEAAGLNSGPRLFNYYAATYYLKGVKRRWRDGRAEDGGEESRHLICRPGSATSPL